LTLGVLAYLAYQVVAPFLSSLAWGVVFAIMAHPIFRRLERRVGSSGAAFGGTAIVAVAVIIPAVLVTAVIAGEAIEASAGIQRRLTDGRLAGLAHTWTAIAQRAVGDGVDVTQSAADLVKRAAEMLVAWSSQALRDAVVFGINIGVALFLTFFLLRDSATIMAMVQRLLPMPPALREAVIVRVRDLVTVGVAAAAVVAAAQGVLGGITFWIVGLPSPAFWGVVMGLLCLLPFGAWLVWLPAAVTLALDGESGRAMAVAAAGFGVVSGVDNVLRPALVSGRAHMHGLVILVGLLGGAAAWGPLGLVAGPVVLGTALALLNAYVQAATEPGSASQTARSRAPTLGAPGVRRHRTAGL
jgi:predicted PurR-regulated permease PerM